MAASSNQHPLQVAIVTAPHSPQDGRFLERDVRLARADLMYADSVELVSPGFQLLDQVAPLGGINEEGAVALLAALDEPTLTYLTGGQPMADGWRDAVAAVTALDADQWDEFGRIANVDLKELSEARRMFDAGLADTIQQMHSSAANTLETSGYREIERARDSGILTVRYLDEHLDDSSLLLKQFVKRMRWLLGPRNKHIHVVLDDQSAAIARAMASEGLVDLHGTAEGRMRRALTGIGLVDRLPAFPDTPIDELLDMRADLSESLSRYRSGVNTLSAELRLSPMHRDAQDEVTDLYVHTVVPQLDALREHLADHPIVIETAKRLATDVKSVIIGVGTPSVSLGIGEVAQLSPVMQGVLAGGAVGALAGQQVLNTWMDDRTAKRQARRSEFFYLLEIDQRTGK